MIQCSSMYVMSHHHLEAHTISQPTSASFVQLAAITAVSTSSCLASASTAAPPLSPASRRHLRRCFFYTEALPSPLGVNKKIINRYSLSIYEQNKTDASTTANKCAVFQINFSECRSALFYSVLIQCPRILHMKL